MGRYASAVVGFLDDKSSTLIVFCKININLNEVLPIELDGNLDGFNGIETAHNPA